ncbi:hypothetical protein [Pseudonocardia thermophila]|jgi:hypothetical protein|uniref:hypothetical protein n=1 Tax=Pseudonocardia thermophila TaxID=1848 RepID=UPI00248EC9D8|nr:hypothetical protein [Pseudonocardia thermophila]
MSMATILAGMPELRRRFLEEHAPDARGRCRECRNEAGPASTWPCVPYRIASEAQRIADGELPTPSSTTSAPRRETRVSAQTRSLLTSPVSDLLSPPERPPARRLKSIPAASWQPRW